MSDEEPRHLSQAGARNRSHQVGCMALRLAEAECTCPRQKPQEDYADWIEPADEAPWWVYGLLVVAAILAASFAFWVFGIGMPR